MVLTQDLFFLKKKKRLWMNYITSDFNQLEDLSA